ncbi:hypothetical protein CYMTET_33342, partial [Cymbomonas tetramitiformis]
ELMNRLSSDTATLQDAATVNISMLLRYVLQILGSLVFMFIISWKLTLVMLAVVPFVAMGTAYYGMSIRKFRKEFQDALAHSAVAGRVSAVCVLCGRSVPSKGAASLATGLGAAQAPGAEWRRAPGRRLARQAPGGDGAAGTGRKSRDVGTVQRAIDGTLYLGWQLSVASAGFQGLVMLISQGAMALVLWYGATLVLNGHMTSGELTSFLLYTVQIAAAFGFLSGIFVSFAQALGASERVFELMAREPGLPVALPPMGDLTATKDLRKEMPEEKAYLVSTVPRSSLDSCVKLKFEDVHFRYPSRPDDPVLKGISFELQPGSVSALVGPSGGGKSTIVGLIER